MPEPITTPSSGHLTIAPAYVDPATGATYVHTDLAPALPPWAVENHVPPVRAAEVFGDVESWAAYVQRYAPLPQASGTISAYPLALLTWNSKQVLAVLDYHTVGGDPPGRCQWTAAHPFEPTSEWTAWNRFAEGSAHKQSDAVETLEELAENITDPPQGDLLNMLRILRVTATHKAEPELREDGTTTVNYSRETGIRAAGLTLPAAMTITVPILRGHYEAGDDGIKRQVVYSATVRIRASVGDNAQLGLRFILANPERLWERAVSERVALARALILPLPVTILRRAG